jgi:hypothetical protein
MDPRPRDGDPGNRVRRRTWAFSFRARSAPADRKLRILALGRRRTDELRAAERSIAERHLPATREAA